MIDIHDGYSRGLPVCVPTSAAPGPIMKEIFPNLKVVCVCVYVCSVCARVCVYLCVCYVWVCVCIYVCVCV